MQVKRIIALVLATLMLVSLVFAGCAKAPADSSSSARSDAVSGDKSSKEQESQPAEPPVELIFYNLGAPAAGNKTVFDSINEKLLAEYNCTVDFQYIDWGDVTTRYPLLFAAGEECDAVFSANWTDYFGYARKGGLLELTDDMLRQYAPLSLNNVTDSQWSQAKVDGKLYMIPMSDNAINDLVYLIRGDLREKYGLDEIDTADGLVEYWDKVVENESDIYAIALGGSGSTDDAGAWVFGTFVTFPKELYNDNYACDWLESVLYASIDMTDHSNVKLVDDSAYLIETFKLMKQFCERGYWSKNALNQTDACTAMYENGRSASCVHTLDSLNGLYLRVMENNPEWKPEIVDIRFREYPLRANPSTNNGCAISVNSRHPEKALTVIDLFNFDRDYYDLVHYGIRGVHWESDDDSSISFLNTGEADQFNGYGMPFTSNLGRLNVKAAPNYDELKSVFKSHVYTPLSALISVDLTGVQAEESAITNVTTKYRPLLQLGFVDDVEATYAAMLDELKAAGIDKYRQAYLTQLQAFLEGYDK